MDYIGVGRSALTAAGLSCGSCGCQSSTAAKFTGDGIMAVFGAPVASEDHAVRACFAALGIQEGRAGSGSTIGAASFSATYAFTVVCSRLPGSAAVRESLHGRGLRSHSGE